jgi:WD40 repeat protein
VVDIVSRRDVALLQSNFQKSAGAFTVAFDRSGKRLLSATNGKLRRIIDKETNFLGGLVQVWDLEQKRNLTNLPHGYGPVGTAFSPDDKLIVSSACDLYDRIHPGELFLWSGVTYEKLHTFSGHKAGAWETVFSPDGRLLATAHTDGSIILWDVESRSLLRSILAHHDIVSALAFSPDGQQLASGSMDEGVSIWSLPGFQETPLGRHERVDSVVFSPDGKWVASGARNQTIKLWNLENLSKKPILLRGHSGRIWSLAFTPDGHQLVSGSFDGTIKLWDWNTVTHQAPSPAETAFGVVFSPDGQLNLRENDLETETVIYAVPSEQIITNLPILKAAFSPGGKIIAGVAKQQLELFDAATFRPIRQIRADYPLAEPVRFSPDAKMLVVCRSPGTVELRNAEREWSIGTVWEMPSSNATINELAFSEDGKYLAAGCSDHSVALFDVRARRPMTERRRSDLNAKPIVWIPGTHVLAIGSVESVVHFWDINSGEVKVLKPEAGNTWALAASPDGKTLAIGTQDGFIKLIHVRTMREMATLRGHLTNVMKMSFSPDGTQLISYGGEGSRLWDGSPYSAREQ